MREPLRLSNAAIIPALEAHYGLAVSALTFLPLGCDSASAAYRVDAVPSAWLRAVRPAGGRRHPDGGREYAAPSAWLRAVRPAGGRRHPDGGREYAADGATYFLKVRAGDGFSVASLVVPRYLHDQGVPHIVAPLPAATGTLWVPVEGFALSLCPFIDARMAADAGLSEAHWTQFGAMVRQMHASQPGHDVLQHVRREAYRPSRRDVMDALEAAIRREPLANPVERELAAFWRSRQDEIRTLVQRADALGQQLRMASLQSVLCHADLHTWNLLLDTAQRIWLVDWDETVLAPKERDLMFVVGGIGRDLVRAHETACFLQGYGEAEIDPLALAYYRYAWAVQDMAAYAERVFFTPDLSRASRRDALHGFVGLFEPGSIVTIAFASDGTLDP